MCPARVPRASTAWGPQPGANYSSRPTILALKQPYLAHQIYVISVGVLLSQLDKSAAARDAIHLVFNEPCSHLRALGRRNGSSPLAPSRDLSFSQQCWSLPQTRFLARLPRQVFLERIILDERGEGERRGRLGGEWGRRGGPAAAVGMQLWQSPLLLHFQPCSCPSAPQAPSLSGFLHCPSCLGPAHGAALKTGLGFCRQTEQSDKKQAQQQRNCTGLTCEEMASKEIPSDPQDSQKRGWQDGFLQLLTNIYFSLNLVMKGQRQKSPAQPCLITQLRAVALSCSITQVWHGDTQRAGAVQLSLTGLLPPS